MIIFYYFVGLCFIIGGLYMITTGDAAYGQALIATGMALGNSGTLASLEEKD
jgi:hypothetical protein